MRKLFGVFIAALAALTFVGVAKAAPWALVLDRDGPPRFAAPTFDGNFIVVGNSATGWSGGPWALKADAGGNILWRRTYGAPNEFAWLEQLVPTADGGYLGIGNFRWSTGNDDLWILKLDASGDVVWQSAYDGTGSGMILPDRATTVQQTRDGGYIVAGDTGRLSSEGGSAIWVLRLDAGGRVRWQKAYGGPGQETAATIRETADGGYILAGTTSSYGLYAADSDVWLLKLDVNGNIVWQRLLGGTKGDSVSAVELTGDGGIVAAGSTSSFGASLDAWVLRLDSGGDVVWQRAFHGADGITLSSIFPTNDGNYITAGSTWSYATTEHFGFMMKLDSNGNIIWQKRYGAVSGLQLSSAVPTSAGGIVVTAYKYSNSAVGARNGSVLLFDANGEAADCMSTASWTATGRETDAKPRVSTAEAITTNAVAVNTPLASEMTSTTPLQSCSTGAPAVVEFYNNSLDHYFITWMPDEIDILDGGTKIKGWRRTGHFFKTYPTAQAGSSPVCRYYIPPGLGDSHFFGRGTVECNATGQKNPSFILEDPAFMQMYLPTAGNCPVNTTQVYRVFSNRSDANHRYMTDKAVRDQMVAKGWLIEGDGPDSVVMCAPR